MFPVALQAPGDLGGRIARAVGWSSVTLGVLQASRLVFGIALARLLTPAQYGVAGMALVFTALVLAVSDLALGAGLVQRHELTEDDRSTVFWTSVVVGGVLTAVGLALASPIAAFYGEPRVEPLLVVLSLGFLITALGRTHAALLHREMNFRSLGLRLMVSTLLGGVAGVACAAKGLGPWALVAQHMTITVAMTVLLWHGHPWRPRFRFSRTSFVDLGRFGLNVLGARMTEYLNLNSDKLLVGRFLGSASLGFYSLAYNLVLVPLAGVLTAVVDALFPALSTIQDDKPRVAAAWLRAQRMVAVVVTPAILGLAVVAPELVRLLVGEKWEAAVPVVQILAATALVQSVSSLATTVLMALGRPGVFFRFTIGELVVVVASLLVGLQFGIVGAAVGYASATVLTRTVLLWLGARTLGVGLGSVVENLRGVAQAAVPTGAALLGARLALDETALPGAVRLLATLAAGAALYVPFLLWRVPQVRSELRVLLQARLSTA
jgi:O-antigen/teichoic acid export membrane protein